MSENLRKATLVVVESLNSLVVHTADIHDNVTGAQYIRITSALEVWQDGDALGQV